MKINSAQYKKDFGIEPENLEIRKAALGSVDIHGPGLMP